MMAKFIKGAYSKAKAAEVAVKEIKGKDRLALAAMGKDIPGKPKMKSRLERRYGT